MFIGFIRDNNDAKRNLIHVNTADSRIQLNHLEKVFGSIVKLVDLDKEQNGVERIFQIDINAIQLLNFMQKYNPRFLSIITILPELRIAFDILLVMRKDFIIIGAEGGCVKLEKVRFIRRELPHAEDVELVHLHYLIHIIILELRKRWRQSRQLYSTSSKSRCSSSALCLALPYSEGSNCFNCAVSS
jgi:hypothetical protein